MQKLSLPIIILLLGVLGCNNSTDTKDVKKDTAVVQQPVDSIALTMAGIYEGFVPCPDCKGIQTYLLLTPDKKFRLEETYMRKGAAVQISEGTWTREKDKILLYEGNNLKLSYLYEQGKVKQLDPSGNPMAGNLGDKFVLTKQEVTYNQAWDEKKKAGVDFLGLGTEPFWAVDIDKDNKVVFTIPLMDVSDTLACKAPTINGKTIEYHLEENGARMDITIHPQFCSDDMSDFLYAYVVRVKYKGTEYSGCGVMLTSL